VIAAGRRRAANQAVTARLAARSAIQRDSPAIRVVGMNTDRGLLGASGDCYLMHHGEVRDEIRAICEALLGLLSNQTTAARVSLAYTCRMPRPKST
jgi:hypothetical protein